MKQNSKLEIKSSPIFTMMKRLLSFAILFVKERVLFFPAVIFMDEQWKPFNELNTIVFDSLPLLFLSNKEPMIDDEQPLYAFNPFSKPLMDEISSQQ
jgi:hypothetical protein